MSNRKLPSIDDFDSSFFNLDNEKRKKILVEMLVSIGIPKEECLGKPPPDDIKKLYDDLKIPYTQVLKAKKLKGSSTNFGKLSMSITYYFSRYHLAAASFFAKQSKDIEDIYSSVDKCKRQELMTQHRSYVIGSIIASNSFLEAVVNEFLTDVYEEREITISLDKNIKSALKKLYKEIVASKGFMPTLEKYQNTLEKMGKDSFDKGKTPYQNVHYATLLRNQLVHAVSIKQSLGEKNTHSLEAKLRTKKFTLNPLIPATSQNPFFPDKCLGYGCAEWVLDNCKKLTDSFFKKIYISPPY